MSLTDLIVESDLAEVAEIRVDPITSHRSLFSMKAFKPEEPIVGFIARATHTTPNYLTVQISDNVHIELLPECLECANHSCEPNCFFNTTTMELMAIKPIKKGDELTFFYPSAEWDMDRSFDCLCGNENCIGVIQGAKHLSKEATAKYRFTDFIRSKLAAKK
jgi:SET domain